MGGGSAQGNAVHLKKLLPKGVHMLFQGYIKGLVRGIRTEKKIPFQENSAHGIGKELSCQLKDLRLEVAERGTLRALRR